MLLIKLWNYLTGYVIIKIVGEYGERLLNHAASKNLYLWDVKRESRNELTAKINVRDFFKLARLAKKTRCRIYVLQRVGLFFIISKLKKRKAFLLGALLFIMAIYLMSSFIWNIEIKCSDDDLSTSVMKSLRQWGLKEGIFKYGLDKEYYLDKLLTEYNNVAWAELEIKGSKLTVELVKKQLPPELEENTPCDIIASKDGIIEEIIHFRGEALVKPGQTVSRGDVLITGKIILDGGQPKKQGEEGSNTLLVHARGIVKARVWYQKVVKVPLVKTKRTPTGNSKKSVIVQFQDHIFNLQWGDIPYTLYDKKLLKKLDILPKLAGGLKYNVVEYIEMEVTKEFLGIEEASREAEAELLLQLGDVSKDDKVTQKKIEFMLDSDEKAVIGSMIIEVVEDIGQKREIV
ncbi:MAG TPA: sporulation protein YqfD [Thermoanaerobacterales bacterium]|nr:sporulation protein YqfD [Thermoanaerobacterales bacterium]